MTSIYRPNRLSLPQASTIKFHLGRMVRYTMCALLLLSGVYSFIRGFNPPISYPLCQWFSTYEFGFIKRGLVGSLIAPLFHFRTGAEIREMVELAAMGIMVLKFLCVGWLARTVVGYARTLGVRSRVPVVVTLMVFLLSPHMVFSAHLAGYFDHLLEIITIIALVAVAKAKYFLLPFLCIAALCVHEMFAIYGLPVIGFAMIVKLFDRSRQPVRFPVALLTAIFAPVLFLGIFLHFAQQVYSTHQLEQMRDRANQYGAVSPAGIQNMVNHLGEGVRDSWRMQRKSGPRSRLTDTAVVKGTYPATALFAIITCTLLLQRRRWFSAALLPVVAVLPLAANFIAWDGYRFASNALFQSFLALFAVVYLTRPKLQLPTVGTVLWLIPLIAVGINHIRQTVPLMDHQIDGSGVFHYEHVLTRGFLNAANLCLPTPRSTLADLPAGSRKGKHLCGNIKCCGSPDTIILPWVDTGSCRFLVSGIQKGRFLGTAPQDVLFRENL